MSFYQEAQGIATDLLAEFDQGGMALMVHSPGNGPPYNPGPDTFQEIPFTGTARGVSAHHLADTLVQSTDLIVIAPGTLSPKMGDLVRIGGHLHNIIKISGKPATGVVAAWEIFVRR